MFTKKPKQDNGSSEKTASVGMTPSPAAQGRTPTTATAAASRSTGQQAGSRSSIIGEELKIVGNIVAKGELHIEGTIEGNVHGVGLVIGSKGNIKGDLIAEDVMIGGRVLGTIRAQRVTLRSGSHVDGDVHHQALAIEQGAMFEGQSRRSDDPIGSTAGSGRPGGSSIGPGFGGVQSSTKH